MTRKSDDDWVLHEECFDEYTAIINGPRLSCRLTIFKVFTKRERQKAEKLLGHNHQISLTAIIYQADAKGTLALFKLKKKIGDFRYDLIKHEYENLNFGTNVRSFARF